MSGYAHSHGRRGAEFDCPHAERRARMARDCLDPGDVLDAYIEAIERMEELVPHFSSGQQWAHGIPGPDAREEIAEIEQVINEHVPEKIHLKSSLLWRMMLGN
jgi:hypothetical protein